MRIPLLSLRTAWHSFLQQALRLRAAAGGAHTVPRAANMRWLARRAPALLGWPGAAGAAVLTACGAFYLSTVLQVQEQVNAVHQRVDDFQEQLRHAGLGANAGQRRPEDQLVQFYRMFPQDSELPQRLEKIFAAAQSQGIGLEEGEYKVTREESGLVRFQMTFPVKGDYPRIRKYLSSLMADIPALSLQQVQFKRQKVGDVMVESNIKLVLYLWERKR